MQSHANLLIATSIENSELTDELKSESTDNTHFLREEFKISDARDLVSQSSSRGFSGQRNFVICSKSMTNEAQNALLKLFEDPPENTSFYLLLPNLSIILPTLLSRLLVISDLGKITPEAVLKDFLSMTYGERVDFIAKLAKTEPSRLKELAIFVGNINSDKIELKEATSLVLRYIDNRGASKKMLAEELALSL